MSVRPLVCGKCHVAGTFDRLSPFPGRGDEASYGVSWRCPQCHGLALDVCPLGPLVPTPAACLNCGTEADPLDDDHPCRDCGLTPAATAAFLDLGPEPVPWPTARGLCDRGLFRRGLAEINRLLLAEPGRIDAYQVKVQVLVALHFYRSVVALLERAFPGAVPDEFLFEWARGLQAVGRDAEAVTAYRQYLQTRPEPSVLAAAHCNLANALAAVGDAAGAETEYRRALDCEGDPLPVRYAYADFLTRQQRWADALAVVDAAVVPGSADPLVLGLWEDKAYLHCELNDGAAALAAADEALKQEPQRVRASFLRGRALALLGRLDEAREQLRRVLALEPDHPDARRGLAMLGGGAAAKPGKPAKRWWQFWK